MIFRLIVLGNPIPKGRPRIVGRHAYTPRRTKDYETLVRDLAGLEWKREPSRARLAMTLKFWRENRRLCDLDNLVKSALDSLNGIVFEDDSQIDVLFAARAIDRDNPRVEILIEELNGMKSQNTKKTEVR